MQLDNFGWEVSMRRGSPELWTVVFGVVVAVMVVGCSRNLAQTIQISPILSRRIPSFKSNGLCLVDALLELGEQAQVPLGIEYVSREALQRPVGKDWDETTVGRVVQYLLARENGYTWQVRGATLNVWHIPVSAGKVNLLDGRLPDFVIPRCSLEQASTVLYMDIDRQRHPYARGYAGNYSSESLQNMVGPYEVRNASVRDILNYLVSSANKKAAWIVRVPPGHLDQLPTQGLWEIVEYANSPHRYAADLTRQIFGW